MFHRLKTNDNAMNDKINIIKKFKDISVDEEKTYFNSLTKGKGAIDIVKKFLNMKIELLEKELTRVTAIYEKDNAEKIIACKLIKRSVYIELYDLLNVK